MKAELSPDEAKIALMFLNRVDLKGNESEMHAFLKSKLMAIRDKREVPDPPANVTTLAGSEGSGEAG